MPKRRTPKTPTETSMVGLINASELSYLLATNRWLGLTDAEIARRTKLSAGFVGMVLNGTRRPSRAFLRAIGFEAVTLYRMKGMHSPTTRGVSSSQSDKT